MVRLNQYTKIIRGKTVLNNIDLCVSKGECIGILGRNASGKTMLLRAMAGLILPTSGTAAVNGQTIKQGHRFPDSMGIIIENIEFWPFMTAKETLEYLNSFRKKASSQDIDHALVKSGLDPADKRKVFKFSLGMRQKLAIAQAIFEKPDLLLFDEPTNSLDKASRSDFYELIRSEKKRGCTVVIASHIKEDLEVCDRLIEIENGVIDHFIDSIQQ